MKFSKREVTAMLGVSMRTLDRHIAAKRLAIEKTSAGKFSQSVFISLEALGHYLGVSDEAQLRVRLGLPQECGAKLAPDAPEQGCAAKLAAEQECVTNLVTDAPELPPLAQRVIDDLEFAEAYKRGEVPDSAGNYHDGRNTRWSETVSLLGPSIPPAPPPDVNAHVPVALRSDSAWDGISADSPDHPLNAGFKGLEVKRPAHNATRQQGLRRALLIRHI